MFRENDDFYSDINSQKLLGSTYATVFIDIRKKISLYKDSEKTKKDYFMLL